MTRLGVLAIVLAVGLFACKEKPAGAAAAIGDREWVLVALGEQKDPVGNGGERVTLRFDLEDSRVSGFGGCNRYTGPYTMTGEKLEFGPIAATKMFCEQGIEVEDKYLPALGSVQSWELAGAELVLKAAGVVVLRFKPL